MLMIGHLIGLGIVRLSLDFVSISQVKVTSFIAVLTGINHYLLRV